MSSKMESSKFEKIREHYLVERELADKLRRASKPERATLYSELYDELYQRVPHHPQLARKVSPEETIAATSTLLKMVKPFLRRDMSFLEVGPGDCAFSFLVAEQVRKVYAVDVSGEITRHTEVPKNFELIISDGCSIPVAEGSVDLAFSNQLMEHLHPDDAFDQLINIFKALKPGGIYICLTPNQLSGPHDVSKYFDKMATGFHLKEYTTGELANLFYRVGFSSVKSIVGVKGHYKCFPAQPSIQMENVLNLVPYRLRVTLAKSSIFRGMLGVNIVGIK